ncbi:unnamed protein product [Owenia fusiformis]|uniref:Uncharacterized protein n=1 Tax=Owenia fusiformis TaxID=6347 RepID=A0A8S4PZD5_OWEFU|nr:unnamed protein product [Owenia fusiformis]
MWIILSVLLLWGDTAEGQHRKDICKEGCFEEEIALNDCRDDYLINITEVSNLYKKCDSCDQNNCDLNNQCYNLKQISDDYRRCNRKKRCFLQIHYVRKETCAIDKRNEYINFQRICYGCIPPDIKTTEAPVTNAITFTTEGYRTSTSEKTQVTTTGSHLNTTIQIAVGDRIDNVVIIATVIAACIVGIVAVTTIICVVLYVRRRALKRNIGMNVYKECGKDDSYVHLSDNATQLEHESSSQKNSNGINFCVSENTNHDETTGPQEHNIDSVLCVHPKGLVSAYEEVDLDMNTQQNEPVRSNTKDDMTSALAYEDVDIDQQDTSGQSGESLNKPPHSNSSDIIAMDKSKAGYEEVDIDNNNPNISIDQLYSKPFKKQHQDSSEIAALYAKPNKGPRALTKDPNSAIQDTNKRVALNDGKTPLLQHNEADQTNHSQEYYSCPIDVDPTYVDDNGDDYDALALGQYQCEVGSEYNGKCYHFDATLSTWSDAEVSCNGFTGGRLAAVHSQGIFDFVKDTISGTANATWENARIACASQGAHLATITSDGENTNVASWQSSWHWYGLKRGLYFWNGRASFADWLKWKTVPSSNLLMSQSCVLADVSNLGLWKTGSCSNTHGFLCESQLVDIDECAQGSHNCHQDAICANTDGSFDCNCNPGYSGDGVTCTDGDECILNTHNCDINAVCSNLPGSFSCNCNPGYSGDGVTCTDDNECILNTHNCDINAVCSNLPGSFSCNCNPGYSGDGVTCTDDNECILNTHNCDINAVCSNIPGSFSCNCIPGYSGDGVSCTDDDECTLNTHNCDINAVCSNIPASFSCTCNFGYTGDGAQCQIIDFNHKQDQDCLRYQGQRLRNHVLRVAGSRSRIDCARLCNTIPTCVAFNFNKNRNINNCELLSQDMDDSPPSDWVIDSEWNYHAVQMRIWE